MRIQEYITEYKDGNVEVSPGVSYSITDVINESHRLFHSKYKGVEESSGFEELFYRIIWIVHNSIVRGSDIDLKDLNMRATNSMSIPIVGLMKLSVRSHLLRTNFGKFVDRVLNEMSWFGSVVTKRVNGSVRVVDLRNIVRDPSIKDIQEGGLAEKIWYTFDDLEASLKDFENKESVIETIELALSQGKTGLHVIEWWTFDKYVKGNEIDGKIHKVCKKYLDRSTVEPEESDTPDTWSPYLMLDEFVTPYKKKRNSKKLRKALGEHEEMFPYNQADFFDAPGRWLGFGSAELLAGLQEHYNEKWNLYRKKDVLDLRGIFVHKYSDRSNSLTQDYLDELDTGTVISMAQDEEFQRLVIDMKTSEFLATIDKLYELSRLIMGISAQGTGEDLPSSVSATASVINQQTQQTTYDFVRERLHHYLVGLFMDGYFEDILGEIEESDLSMIVGDPRELEELDRYFVENLVNSKAIEWKHKTGMYPTEKDVDMLKEMLINKQKQLGDMRFPELKKTLMDKVGYSIEFYVTNESFDSGRKIQNMMMMIQDPNFTGSRAAVEATILDLMNENAGMYRKTREEKEAEAEQQRQQMVMEMMAQQKPSNPATPVAIPEMGKYTNEEQVMRANRV